MNKTYILQRKWPDAEIGDVYQWNGAGYSNQTRVAKVVYKKWVEESPDWFKEKEHTKEWEIVAYKRKDRPDCISTKRANGLFLNAKEPEYKDGQYNEPKSINGIVTQLFIATIIPFVPITNIMQ